VGVREVADDSPVVDQIFPGDWIMSVNQYSVHGSSVDFIYKELFATSHQPSRCLRVLRAEGPISCAKPPIHVPISEENLESNKHNLIASEKTEDKLIHKANKIAESHTPQNTSRPSILKNRVEFKVPLPSVPLYGFTIEPPRPEHAGYVWVSKVERDSPLVGILFPGD
jgi:hypothetical protein